MSLNKIKQKKAALELSIGTIVVIVIAMSMLILGIILVRQVMCAGIVLTEKVTQETEDEILNLFSTNEHGIKCMGEGGDSPVLGSGGSRQIVCIANLNTAEENKITLVSAELIKGRIGNYKVISPGSGSSVDIKNSPIVLDSGWGTGTIQTGKTSLVVATLDFPEEIDSSTIKLVFKEEKDGTLHPLIIQVEPVGTFTAAIC